MAFAQKFGDVDFGMVDLQSGERCAVAVSIVLTQVGRGRFGEFEAACHIACHGAVDECEDAGIGIVQRVVEVEQPHGRVFLHFEP